MKSTGGHDMTRYEKGFIEKCAEAGLSADDAMALYKRAGIVTAMKKLVGRGLMGTEHAMVKSRGMFGENVPKLWDKIHLALGRTGYHLDPEHAFNTVAKRRGNRLPFPNESIWRYL